MPSSKSWLNKYVLLHNSCEHQHWQQGQKLSPMYTSTRGFLIFRCALLALKNIFNELSSGFFSATAFMSVSLDISLQLLLVRFIYWRVSSFEYLYSIWTPRTWSKSKLSDFKRVVFVGKISFSRSCFILVNELGTFSSVENHSDNFMNSICQKLFI